MTLEQMFALKVGDKIVQVRKHFQNYDHTLIPCEPMVYTVSWKGTGEMSLKENVKTPFYHSDDKIIYARAGGFDNRQICDEFETLENYINNNFRSTIILDSERWLNGLEEMLVYKANYDHEIAKEKADEYEKELKRKHFE